MIRGRGKPDPAIPEEIPKTVPPRTPPGRKLHYQIANLQGIGRRENQEDSFAFGNALDEEAIAQKGLLAIVADGMGGLQGGKTASETAITAILTAFESFDPEADPIQQLQTALWDADAAVTEKLRGAGGSTCVAGLILEDKLYYVSVGDSYVFLLHDHRLTRLNRSHNVFCRDMLEEFSAGTYFPEKVRRNPEKDALTCYLGMGGLEEIDLLRKPWRLRAGDVLLLCSDGVGGVLDQGCLEDCLCYGHPEEMIAAIQKEIKAANQKYQDNYTALIVQCRS